MNKSTMYMLAYALCIVLAGWSMPVEANPRLNEVSFAERADGKGYVVRLHTSESIPTNDFLVDRGDRDVLRVTLYNTRIGAKLLRGPAMGPVREYTVRQRRRRVVIQFILDPETPLSIAAYPDRSSKHMLVALNYAQPIGPIARVPATPSTEKADTASDESPKPPVIRTSGPPPNQSLADGTRWILDCVVLDAGHGGHDRGARANKVNEKDVNLAVTLRLGKLIEENLGMRVVYTRKTDKFIDLNERGHIANQKCGKLFISIHANAASRKAHGSETYFLGLHKTNTARDVMERENSVIKLEDDPTQYQDMSESQLIMHTLTQSTYLQSSEHLAGLIEREFGKKPKRISRGVKQAGFIVLWQASMPAVLVELGFVTNPTEARFMKSKAGQESLAQSIFRAVREYKATYEKSLVPTIAE